MDATYKNTKYELPLISYLYKQMLAILLWHSLSHKMKLHKILKFFMLKLKLQL